MNIKELGSKCLRSARWASVEWTDRTLRFRKTMPDSSCDAVAFERPVIHKC